MASEKNKLDKLEANKKLTNLNLFQMVTSLDTFFDKNTEPVFFFFRVKAGAS